MRQLQLLLFIGSSLPNTDNIEHAVNQLKTLGRIIEATPVMAFPSVSNDRLIYKNALLILKTSKSQALLQRKIKEIEVIMGREELRSTGVVTIDIDILATKNSAKWVGSVKAKTMLKWPPVTQLLRTLTSPMQEQLGTIL